MRHDRNFVRAGRAPRDERFLERAASRQLSNEGARRHFYVAQCTGRAACVSVCVMEPRTFVYCLVPTEKRDNGSADDVYRRRARNVRILNPFKLTTGRRYESGRLSYGGLRARAYVRPGPRISICTVARTGRTDGR